MYHKSSHLGYEWSEGQNGANSGHLGGGRRAIRPVYQRATACADKYADIVQTRQFEDRIDTLQRVRGAGVKVCCGGIVGMGETRTQRAALIAELANMEPYPESVPINHLVPVEGTPLHGQAPLDPFEFVRTIAAARITMPHTRVRLSAGRQALGDAVQALCFLAGP